MVLAPLKKKLPTAPDEAEAPLKERVIANTSLAIRSPGAAKLVYLIRIRCIAAVERPYLSLLRQYGEVILKSSRGDAYVTLKLPVVLTCAYPIALLNARTL